MIREDIARTAGGTPMDQAHMHALSALFPADDTVQLATPVWSPDGKPAALAISDRRVAYVRCSFFGTVKDSWMVGLGEIEEVDYVHQRAHHGGVDITGPDRTYRYGCSHKLAFVTIDLVRALQKDLAKSSQPSELELDGGETYWDYLQRRQNGR